MSRLPNRTVAPDSASTRDMILESATSLFAELGYTRASLSLVADELGVTRQAFYYHFRSKGDILAALFDRAMTLVEREVAARPARADRVHYVDLLTGHIEVVLKNVDLIKITTHERPSIDELAGAGAVARRAAYSRTFTRVYQDGVAAGQLRAGNPMITVQSNLSTVNTVSTWWKPATGPRASSVQAELIDVLCHGLLA